MNRFIIILLFIFLNSNCVYHKSKDTKLSEYLSQKKVSVDSLEAIFVLDETRCVNCNKSFSIFISNHLKNPKIKTVLIAKGRRIDISTLLDSENTIIDFGGRFYKLGLCQSSSTILVKDGKIDAIIELNAKDLENNLLYLDFILNDKNKY